MVDRRNRDLEVVEAAVRVFHEKGYAAATVQDVADAVGVLKGSLYHYISSKEDLLFRILTESHAQARVIMDQVSTMDAPAVERLRVYLHDMYGWYLSHVERSSVYLNQQHNLTGERAAQMRAQAREFEHFLRELLAEAKGAGALRGDLDIRLAALFLLGVLNSIPRWYKPDGRFPPEALAAAFTDMSLRALAAGATFSPGAEQMLARLTPQPTAV